MQLLNYYCDYCDKQFQDAPSARKRHLQGLHHLSSSESQFQFPSGTPRNSSPPLPSPGREMDSDGGGDRKRRRTTTDHGDQGLQRNDHEDEEDDDVSKEEKMKAFFDLIQAARGAREQFFGRKMAEGYDDKSRRQPAIPRVWNPTFQSSDFVDDPGRDIAKVPVAETGGPSRQEANPGKGEGKEDDDEGRMKRDGGVNLKLSL